jgi:hypothetical protein
MNRKTQKLVRSVETVIGRLIEACQKDGRLYDTHPQVVAHVSRTSKWLLNALAKLQTELTRFKENE